MGCRMLQADCCPEAAHQAEIIHVWSICRSERSWGRVQLCCRQTYVLEQATKALVIRCQGAEGSGGICCTQLCPIAAYHG